MSNTSGSSPPPAAATRVVALEALPSPSLIPLAEHTIELGAVVDDRPRRRGPIFVEDPEFPEHPA